jgi:hypothetical protein
VGKRIWLQRLALLPLWAVYVWWFRQVLLEWPRADLIRSVSLLAAVACLYGAGVLLWVRHNRRLARRGERLRSREVRADFSRDVLGRPVVAHPEALAARRLVVEVRDGRKYYLPAHEPQTAEPEPAYAGMDSVR